LRDDFIELVTLSSNMMVHAAQRQANKFLTQDIEQENSVEGQDLLMGITDLGPLSNFLFDIVDLFAQ
jgi:hypothetical protein